MKIGTLILDTKLKYGIENANYTTQGSICNICRVASKVKKTTCMSDQNLIYVILIPNYKIRFKIRIS